MIFDLLERRKENFTLWIPGGVKKTPSLILGTIDNAVPANFTQNFEGLLIEGDVPDIWELDPKTIQPPLQDEANTSPNNLGTIRVTDPLAYTVDYRTTIRDDHIPPPAAIKFRDSKLWTCDVDGAEADQVKIPTQEDIPNNNHLVIYELPASWAKSITDSRGVNVDFETFIDVLALFDKKPPVSTSKASHKFPAALFYLISASTQWKFFPLRIASQKDNGDYDLGTSSELVELINNIHARKIRFFTDVVMAFGHDPYVHIAFDQFHIQPYDGRDEDDNWQSHMNKKLRDGFGGRNWKYIQNTTTYDPKSGQAVKTKSL